MLGRYDIESFLIDEQAICQFAEQEKPRISQTQWEEVLGFGDWQSEMLDSAVRLCASWALAAMRNIHYDDRFGTVYAFVPASQIAPSTEQIEAFIGDVKDEQDVLKDKDFDTQIQNLSSMIGASLSDKVRWIRKTSLNPSVDDLT